MLRWGTTDLVKKRDLDIFAGYNIWIDFILLHWKQMWEAMFCRNTSYRDRASYVKYSFSMMVAILPMPC